MLRRLSGKKSCIHEKHPMRLTFRPNRGGLGRFETVPAANWQLSGRVRHLLKGLGAHTRQHALLDASF